MLFHFYLTNLVDGLVGLEEPSILLHQLFVLFLAHVLGGLVQFLHFLLKVVFVDELFHAHPLLGFLLEDGLVDILEVFLLDLLVVELRFDGVVGTDFFVLVLESVEVVFLLDEVVVFLGHPAFVLGVFLPQVLHFGRQHVDLLGEVVRRSHFLQLPLVVFEELVLALDLGVHLHHLLLFVFDLALALDDP